MMNSPFPIALTSARQRVMACRFMLAAAGLVAALLGLAPVPPLHAQDSTIVITTAQVLEAAANGFGFSLTEQQFGSRCFSVSGQNNGQGAWGRAVSEGLNFYARSLCRHSGFGTKNLQNGWTVSAVSSTQSCQFNDWGTWRTLAASNCTFSNITTPAVGSTSAFFRADIAVNGTAAQDRRATLTWSITIRGPRGKSPWVAQPPSAPILSSPANGARSLGGVANFSWTAPATGATEYRLCISRESMTRGCEERARVTTPQAPNVTVPFPGERVRWFVRACNAQGCTASTEARTLINPLPSAVLVSPAAGATAANRRPTFQWQSVPGAQTYTLYVYHPNPLQDWSLPSLSSNQTQFTPATDLTLASPVYWSVNACTTAAGCGSPATPQQVHQLNLPPVFSFATDLAPTFRHERCVNCHAVAATNFARVSPGLGSNHSTVSASTNCQSCHTNTLLPADGTVNPGWHAAPSSMDLRGLSDAQLCQRATNPGSVAGSVLNHLTQDKLILWAIADGRLPNGITRPTAPPNSVTTWRSRVQAWLAAGMPCPS